MFFNKNVEGDIGYYKLEGWWLETFTKDERKKIEGVYKPMGGDANRKPLTEGKIESSSQSKAFFLSTLAGWFNNPRNRSIANKIVEKAEEVIEENPSDDLTPYFVYSEMISIYYAQRENVEMLNKAIQACKKQIKIGPLTKVALRKDYEKSQIENRKCSKDPMMKELEVWNGTKYVAWKDYDFDSEFNKFSLPSHKGYEQLAIILNKQGKDDEAIKLCNEAKNQGWAGDWDKRIARYSKKK